MKTLQIILSFLFLIAGFSFAKTETGDEIKGGSTEVKYVEENPAPVPSAADKVRGYIIFKRTYNDRIYAVTNPKKNEITDKTSLFVARGEYEPVQIGVYPLSDLGEVKISAGDITDGKGAKASGLTAEIRVVRYMAQQVGLAYMKNVMIVPKTLEVRKDPVNISKGVTRGYWVTFYAAENAAAGQYGTDITLTPANGKTSKFHIDVEVLPFKLENPDVIYSALYSFELAGIGSAKKGIDKASSKWKIAESIYRDMKEHGMTAGSPESQQNYEEKNGQPYLADLEASLELEKQVGMIHPVLYYCGPLLNTQKMKNNPGYKNYNVTKDSATAVKVAKYYADKCKKEELPGVIYLTVDEPGFNDGLKDGDPGDIRQKMAYDLSKALKGVGAMTGLTCTPESMTKPLQTVIDYWILASLSPEIETAAKTANAKLGMYNGSIFSQQGQSVRYYWGVYGWAKKLKAVTSWTYPLGSFGKATDFMRLASKKLKESGTKLKDGILGEDGKPVTIIQWELAREGVDDAKYIYMLEKLVEKNAASGKPAVAKAKQLLDAVRTDVLTERKGKNKGPVFDHYASSELLEDPIWTMERFDTVRKQVADLIKELQ